MSSEILSVISKSDVFEIKVENEQKGSSYSIMLSHSAYEQLRQYFVDSLNFDSNKLTKCSNCGDKVKMISTGEFCPNCFC